MPEDKANGNASIYTDSKTIMEKETKYMEEKKSIMPKRVDPKKFVRYGEGAVLYSMSRGKFEELAKAAGVVYKLNKLVLVNTVIFEAYLETFRVVEG